MAPRPTASRRATWSIWERGMQDTASFPSFGDAWKNCVQNMTHTRSFKISVDELLPNVSSKDKLDRSPSRNLP